MSREIKFRAWDKGSEYMHSNVQSAVYEDPDEWTEFNTVLGLERFEVMQYTGLKDKNGKEIYEGDILTSSEYPFQDDGEYNYHGVVEWGEEEAAYYLTKHLANKNRRGISHGISEMLGQEDMSTFEIIGNIYENPELLEATA